MEYSGRELKINLYIFNRKMNSLHLAYALRDEIQHNYKVFFHAKIFFQ